MVIISLMDLGWVLGSLVVLALGGHLFTGVGQVVIAVVAAFVGLFGAGQFLGARAIRPTLSKAFVQVLRTEDPGRVWIGQLMHHSGWFGA